jgi:hypothetical protein
MIRYFSLNEYDEDDVINNYIYNKILLYIKSLVDNYNYWGVDDGEPINMSL